MKKLLLSILLGCVLAVFPQGSSIQFARPTQVSGVAPIAVTSNTIISMPQSSSVTDGWLSSVDWNTFNNGALNNWKTTGNSGLTYFTRFLGNTDNKSLFFRNNTAGSTIGYVKVDSLDQVTILADTNSFNPALTIKGTNNNNAYMQLVCPNISAYRLKNYYTGYEWYLQNQTFGGGLGTDAFAIGVTSNPQACFFQLSKRGEMKTESYYNNNLIIGLQLDSAGHLAMGSSVPGAASFRMNNTHRGGATGTGFLINGQIATDVTTAFRGILVQPTYSNSASRGAYTGIIAGTPSMGTNTLTSLLYFDTGTELAAATVTGDTYGYFCRPNVVATRNVWAFFANGTAPSFFRGPVSIGSTTAAASGFSMDVNGSVGLRSTLTVTNTSTFTGGLTVASTGGASLVGTVTLVGGTATVNTTKSVTGCFIFFQRKTSGGTIGTSTTYTVSNGVSFTLTSDNVLDTSTFNWWIINP